MLLFKSGFSLRYVVGNYIFCEEKSELAIGIVYQCKSKTLKSLHLNFFPQKLFLLKITAKNIVEELWFLF